jgi:DNA-binding transcriptional ArsR family regulator
MSTDFSVALKRIEEKLDAIMKTLESQASQTKNMDIAPARSDPSLNGTINVYLLKLPDSLRQTMLAMGKLKDAITEDVAKETGRSRSLESIHLNQLERMGYIEKYRRKRKIFFTIPNPSK